MRVPTFAMALLSFAVACVFASPTVEKEIISVEALTTISDIGPMAVSPDGSYVSYRVITPNVEDNAYITEWYYVRTDGRSKPSSLGLGGDTVLSLGAAGKRSGQIASSNIVWSPDSTWFAYTLHENGETQVWRSDVGRPGRTQVTQSVGDVDGVQISSDGTKLFYAFGRDRAERSSKDQLDSRVGYRVQHPPVYSVEHGALWPRCTSETTKWREVESTRLCALSVRVVDLSNNSERQATNDEAQSFFNARRSSQNRIRSSSDGIWTASFENFDAEKYTGFSTPKRLVAVKGDEVIPCTSDACKTQRPVGIWWRDVKGQQELIFLVRDGFNHTMHSVYAWTPGKSEVRTVLRTEDTFHECELVRERLICGREGWTVPRQIVSIDLGTGDVSTLVDVNERFGAIRFTTVEKILGEDAYGNPSHAHLVYPISYAPDKRYPLVIVQYRSRGFLRGGVGDAYPIHVMAQRGLAVLSVDMPEDEEAMFTIDNVADLYARDLEYRILERGPATAIESMVDALVARRIVDPDRVGITGISAGSMTLDSAILERNYAAAATPTSHSIPMGLSGSTSQAWNDAMNYELFQSQPYTIRGIQARSKYSIAASASSIDTPILFQVSDREFNLTEQNYLALEAAGKPVEMWIFPDEYHVKWQPAHRYNVYRRNLQWFLYWLKGEEVDDPVDPEQYVRWHLLREQHESNLTKLEPTE